LLAEEEEAEEIMVAAEEPVDLEQQQEVQLLLEHLIPL
jgi:hypothetical protein